MPFYINSGYFLSLPDNVNPDGTILNCSGMPYPQLLRKKFTRTMAHTQNRLFDPQYYLLQLDPHESPKPCYKLVTYPWFGANNLPEFDSDVYNLREYNRQQKARIIEIWGSKSYETEETIITAVAQAIEFQVHIGCKAIILPSPLTEDASTNYTRELNWLDAGINYIKQNNIDIPYFATVALSDTCLRYLQISENPIIDLILDVISSRDVHGVYLVVDQRLEHDRTRYLGNFNTIRSVIEIIHRFSFENGIRAVVNYFGPFGVVFLSMGAIIWSTDWYKSLVRLRLSDQIGKGFAYPMYWSTPLACDINLNGDLDELNQNGLLPIFSDITTASQGLLTGLGRGLSVQDIPAWQYKPSNTTATMEHYRLSMIELNRRVNQLPINARLDFINQWLVKASENLHIVKGIIGDDPASKIAHVEAWKDAIIDYRRFHNI